MEPRPPAAHRLRHKQQRHERQRRHEQGIATPRSGDIGVEQRMDRPLRAAAGTLQARQRKKRAPGERRRGRIEQRIYRHGDRQRQRSYGP